MSRESMYIRLKREILSLTHGRPGHQIKIALSPNVSQYFEERKARRAAKPVTPPEAAPSVSV